jgi:hypothetical protein
MKLIRGLTDMLLTTMLCTSAGMVGTASAATGTFNVNINLVPAFASGICTSSALSQQTNALVRVTCSGGQFVSIEPRPGSNFGGVHGGAWRFTFPRASAIPQFLMADGEVQPQIGVGTITAMRVLEIKERDETLELLVSF